MSLREYLGWISVSRYVQGRAEQDFTSRQYYFAARYNWCCLTSCVRESAVFTAFIFGGLCYFYWQRRQRICGKKRETGTEGRPGSPTRTIAQLIWSMCANALLYICNYN